MKRATWIGALVAGALSCQGTWQAIPAVPPAAVQPAPAAVVPPPPQDTTLTPTPAPTPTAPAANTEEVRRQCIVQCGEAEAICKEQCDDERCWGECSDQEWSCRRQC